MDCLVLIIPLQVVFLWGLILVMGGL